MKFVKQRPSMVVLASGNPHKASEFDALMLDIVVEPMPDDFSLPPETGTTYYENALLKAEAVHEQYARQAGVDIPWVMADDSGIEVEALGGGPGIFSARYAGEDATDVDNVNKLLLELEGKQDRRACFVCVIACISPAGDELRADGIFPGTIALETRGYTGFGYDPVFIPDGFSLTVSEISAEEKNRISHRARAAQGLLTQFGGGVTLNSS